MSISISDYFLRDEEPTQRDCICRIMFLTLASLLTAATRISLILQQ